MGEVRDLIGISVAVITSKGLCLFIYERDSSLIMIYDQEQLIRDLDVL